MNLTPFELKLLLAGYIERAQALLEDDTWNERSIKKLQFVCEKLHSISAEMIKLLQEGEK